MVYEPMTLSKAGGETWQVVKKTWEVLLFAQLEAGVRTAKSATMLVPVPVTTQGSSTMGEGSFKKRILWWHAEVGEARRRRRRRGQKSVLKTSPEGHETVLESGRASVCLTQVCGDRLMKRAKRVRG